MTLSMKLTTVLDQVGDLLELTQEELKANTANQLKKWAKLLGIPKAYKMKKAQLVKVCWQEIEGLNLRLSVEEEQRKKGEQAIKKLKKNDEYTIPITQVSTVIYNRIKTILQEEESLSVMKEKINGIVASTARQEMGNYKFSTVKSRRSDLFKFLNHSVSTEGTLLKDDMTTLITYFHKQYLSFLMEDSLELNKTYRKNVSAKNTTKTPLEVSKLVADCRNALEQLEAGRIVHWSKIAVALALGTGRRACEIHALGNFEVRGDYCLFFSGQAKTRNSDDAQDNFLIPTLFPAAQLLKGWQYLKEQGRTIPAQEQKADRNATNKKFRVQHHRAMDYYPGLSFKDLRSIYAELCWNLLSPKTQQQTSQHIYYSTILGHLKEAEGAGGTTFKSYLKFYIVDLEDLKESFRKASGSIDKLFHPFSQS